MTFAARNLHIPAVAARNRLRAIPRWVRSVTSPGKATVPVGKPRFLISDLCTLLTSYLSAEQIREVYRAYLFGAEAHEGQWRKSGEPYIYHPIAVARLLADMRMDYKCLMAALLHDVIETVFYGDACHLMVLRPKIGGS